ncbi:hypothetical protein C8J57DRAFT_1213001 [Mycena rebaudengoi]|nr:hypothetical protein C8J57DRAFT_1213001 [Mycena rebaudengoi]
MLSAGKPYMKGDVDNPRSNSPWCFLKQVYEDAHMGDMPPHVRRVGQYHLILAPRDSIFQVPPEEERRLIKEYRAALDGQHPQKSDNDYTTGDIYDCLAYAHRGHASSVAVMMDLRRLGIACWSFCLKEFDP